MKVLVALGLLQAALVVAVGVGLAALADDPELQRELALAGDLLAESTIRTTGIALVVVGAVHALLALGLAMRSSIARTIYGVVATLQAAVSVYGLVALRDAREGGVVTFAVAAAVLWFLYGTDETQAYFDEEPAAA